MTTDMERELRELFREKAGEAPLATFNSPTAAPQEVLRRGRRRQVGTVIGSAAIVLVLIVGSVAGLNTLLRGDGDPFTTGQYEVFERTATIEAFTVTSPSDWFLVNEWPLSMQMAVGSGSASGECTAAAPGAAQPSPVCTETTQSPQVEALPSGLPMFQLSNVDMGLNTVSCGQNLATDTAVLYVGLDYERAIFGAKDPSIGPWPVELQEPEAAGGPCGAGRYATFSVNGQPFFAWVGFGDGVTDTDRATALAAYESLTVDDGWEPIPPNNVTPAYVMAGGENGPGDDWRLELRPEGNAIELSLQDGPAPTVLLTDGPVEPLAWTGTDPIFGAITKVATGVEFRPGTDNVNVALGQSPVAGTIMPLPPTLSSFDFDLFFIDQPEDYGELGGRVIALGIDGGIRPSPTPASEPQADVVSLSGGDAEHTWIVRFTGAFDDGSACIGVRLDAEASDPLCPGAPALPNSFAGSLPSMHGWLTSYYLLAGSVPPEVADIRFVDTDGQASIRELQCTTGPVGWTEKKVCVISLPSEGSGTLEYLDAGGNVVYVDGLGWGSSYPAELGGPPPVDPVHGGTYWAVYPWVGAAGDPAADAMVGRLFDQFGIQAVQGEVGCDQGAAEALGPEAQWRVGVYFDTRVDARAFVDQLAISGGVTDAPIAQVTTYCLD
jgi:hypothetical protein